MNSINKLEQIFLEFIDYKLVIRGSEYAKYYFILKTLAGDIYKENGTKLDPFEAEKRNKWKKKSGISSRYECPYKLTRY